MKTIDTPADLPNEPRQMLMAYLGWLKGWDERNTDLSPMADGLTLDDYWLKVTPGIAKILPGTEVGSYIDMPTIYIDQEFGDRRVIVLACSPFHDEGGPAILTGFFAPAAVPEDGEGAWGLRALVQEFDTMHSLLMSDMKLVWD